MNMICHQNVGVERALKFLGLLSQNPKIAPVVFIGVKAPAAIITALYDVPRDPRHREACSSRHNDLPVIYASQAISVSD